jgi:Leucine-rich repeat (LRR) protein
MDGDRCSEISFHRKDCPLGGTIRRHPLKTRIVSMVCAFPYLRKLDLRKCKVAQIEEMASRDLEYLDLSCNDLATMPSWVLKQHGLKTLNLGGNRIQWLPDLSSLPLETLKLHKNQLTETPAIWGGIKCLNIFLNRMNAIPSILGYPELEVFTFGVSAAVHLPPLASLPALRWLTIAANQIERLPDDIVGLKHLEGLILPKNRLKALPDHFGDLNLQALNLYSNDLARLPESFYRLKLNKLNLARNPLLNPDRVRQVFGEIDFIQI